MGDGCRFQPLIFHDVIFFDVFNFRCFEMESLWYTVINNLHMSSYFQTPNISKIIFSTFMSPLLVHTSYTHLYYMCPILSISLDFGLITILKGTLLRFYSCNFLGASNPQKIITFSTNHWAPIVLRKGDVWVHVNLYTINPLVMCDVFQLWK